MFKQILKSGSSCNLNQILPGTLKNVAAMCPSTIQYQNVQTFATAPATTKWDLYSSVCLERHPIIIQPMQEIETRFYNLLKKIEFENSLQNDHELKKEKEKKDKKDKKSSNIDDFDLTSMQTAQDFEDSSQEELQNFKFAPTTTKFDEQNITSTVKRKLDKNLLLLVQQKVGNTDFWIPPQGIRQEGETMRQTAERVLQDICGTKLKAKFYGNAPIGFYKYKYPEEHRKAGICGAKIFYFLAKYVEGDITDGAKYQWLDHEELEKVLPNRMQRSISLFLL